MTRPRPPLGAAFAALVALFLPPLVQVAQTAETSRVQPATSPILEALERARPRQRRDAPARAAGNSIVPTPAPDRFAGSLRPTAIAEAPRRPLGAQRRPGETSVAERFVLPAEPFAAGKAAPPRLDGIILDLRTMDLASAGDIEGNGTTDWVRGEPRFSSAPLTAQGHVVIDRRAPNGSITTQEIVGPTSFSGFGHSVGSAGDVNGDGFDDVIVGAPHYGLQNGRAWVFRGASTHLSTSQWWLVEGATQDHLGYSVAGAGDVNGDGFDDVIVGSPGAASNGFFFNGRAQVWLGSSIGLSPTPAWTVEGGHHQEMLGFSVAGNGDINADGYADVAVVSSGYSNGQAGEGRVQVFLGGPAGLATTSAFSYETNQAGWGQDAQVSMPGDFNGDGFGDLAMGFPYADSPATDDGRVSIWAGFSIPVFMDEIYFLTGGTNDAHFGKDVMPAGDLNGDGLADLVASAPDFEDPGNFYGLIVEMYGASNASVSYNPYVVRVGDNLERRGIAVAGGGDLGDGKPSYLVGTELLPALTPPTESVAGVGPLSFDVVAGHVWEDLPPRSFAQGSFHGYDFGSSIALADVNGDGFSDVIAGGAFYSEFLPQQGHVLAYYGDAAGFSESPPFAKTPRLDGGGNPFQSPDWSFAGPTENGQFGFSVANAGDVNGDGYDDVLVGALAHTNGESAEGAAYLFLGGPDGLAIAPEWVTEGNAATALYGYAVGGAGDVNQDGYDDILVGAPLASPPGIPGGGRVYFYYGSPHGPGHVPARVFDGSIAGAHLGGSVAGIGDVDGDGDPEVAMSEVDYANGQVGEGRVLAYRGGPGGIEPQPFLDWESDLENSYTGLPVAPAGDVNGDGYADLVVGAYGFTNVQLGEGAIHLFLGSPSGFTSAPDQTIEGGANGAQFGLAARGLGDLNDDGFGEVIVGSPGFTDVVAPGDPGTQGVTTNGRCRVHFGSPTGLEVVPRYTYDFLNTGYLGSEIGRAVAGGGDVNGDGWPDLVFSAPSASAGKLSDNGVLFIGFDNVIGITNPSHPARALRSDNTTPIAHGLRSDLPTSFRVRGIARTPVGRGKVRLQWQAKAPGQPLDLTGIGSSSLLRTGTAGLDGSSIVLGGTAGSLAQGQHYRVRTRLATRHPYFQRSRWFTSPRNGVLESDLRTAGPTGFTDVGDPGGGGAGGLSFAGAAPNPIVFGEPAALRFALARAGHVTIDAWDAAGRHVARVFDGTREAGLSHVAWDGRDEAGRALPRGLYFLRLVSGGERREAKVVIASGRMP